ncbi:MAG: hypothetical protein AB1540_10865 [Bdellovibrionota bacterium]
MTKYAVFLSLIFSSFAFAHDEGHGPKLTGVGDEGGMLYSVIEKNPKKVAKKGAEKHSDKPSLVYQAELVREKDEQGNPKIKVYLYEAEMVDGKLKRLEAEQMPDGAHGIVEVMKDLKKKKWVKESEFKLAKNEKFLEGKPKSPSKKPFNIDVTMKEKSGRELLVAFDGLE